MKIVELELETGLDRATIRYYEKEGFIAPVRLDNGYRDYSVADQEHLLKIKLLRQLGMSLDRIRNLQQGSEDFSAALADQVRFLEARIQTTQQAKFVCQQMQEACVRYDTLDARTYLKMLSQPASPAIPKVSRTYREPAAVVQPHPWRRYFARCLDYALIQMVVMFVIVVIFRVRPYDDFLSNVVSYGSPFLAVPIMALLLHVLGTTPGKWLFGLEVYDAAGGRLSFSAAVMREWSALRDGYGFGIPFWSLWLLYKNYRVCSSTEDMEWDQEMSCEYICHNWRGKRKLAMAAASILIALISILLGFDAVMPKHRGELTVAQFAENYNHLAYVLDEDVSNFDLLLEDGTRPEPSQQGGNVVIIGGNMTSENRNYRYETKDGKLTKLIYDNTWTNIFMARPTGDMSFMPAMTLLMSQKGTTYLDILELSEVWEQNQGLKEANFSVRNIEVSWEMETVNCVYDQAGNFYAQWDSDSDQESTVTLHLEITIH